MDGLELNRDHFQGDHDKVPIKRKPFPKTSGPLFTIPRLKKIKRDLLTDLTLDSHECQHDILAPVRKSFHFIASNSCHEFTKVQAVYNSDSTAKYLERRKEMKASGYPDALLAEMFAFIQVDSLSTAEKMCREGIRCGNQQFSGLGVSHMAVHVCKHADIVTANRPKLGEKILLVVKVVKGKMKTVLCKNVGVQLEPTPNYDCHIAKPNVDQAAVLAPHMLLYSTQLYLYEYGDYEIVDYPRQVLPYAIVHYTLKEAQPVLPKPVTSLPHQGQVPLTTAASATQAPAKPYQPQATPQDSGPSNEVWRGRLHVRLVAGGQIFIDVTMLSHFVPLTVSLISPIMIHHLYPEHNAQFTFFYGLSNIALKDEVEWRAHYFKSFIMRPRPNNEEHFKALVKHISDKREMPTVKLPNDVYLFLMPNCLLASQLGLVRRDDDSPVLHCVLMSKFSTNEAQRKKLLDRKSIFKKFGSAASWENLFDDSDFSDDGDEVKMSNKAGLSRTLSSIFREQRNIHNKFAAMSIVDADLNFFQCSCKKLSAAKTHHQKCRDKDVVRVLSACKSSSHSSRKGAHPKVSEISDQRPKQKMSKKTKSMPSFSPHGSSDSDSGAENGKGHSRRHRNRFSLLNSTKTVEEELSEEELTNEQMEDIIFLRKPALTTVSSFRPKLSGQPQAHKTAMAPSVPTNQKHSRPKLESSKSQSVQELHKSSSEPLFSSKPKIIPTEPLEPIVIKTKPKIIPPPEPKIIPSEPVVSENKKELEKPKADLNSKPLKPEISSSNESFVPKSILKKKPGGSQDSKLKMALPLTSNQHEVTSNHQETTSNQHEVVVQKGEDFGDVDMRFSMTGPVTLHPVFLSARQPPSLALSPAATGPQQLSPNFSLGSWLAPNEIQGAPLLENSDNDQGPSSPTSPVSSPAESPPSPIDSPISPPLDSPSPQHSPTVAVDIESPASPPQSMFLDQLRSSPIAIPTTRVLHNVSPEVSFIHRLPSSALPQGSKSKERIDSANDMKNFLNSGFESDLDSSYEDERVLSNQDGKKRCVCYQSVNLSNSMLCKPRQRAADVRFGNNLFQPCNRCKNRRKSLPVCPYCQRVAKTLHFSCHVECPTSECQMLKLFLQQPGWSSHMGINEKSLLHERNKSLLAPCLASRVLVADPCKQTQTQRTSIKMKSNWTEVGRRETFLSDYIKKKCTNRYKRDLENIESVLSSASAVIDSLDLSICEPSHENARGHDLVWWGTKNFPEVFNDLCHKVGLYGSADRFFQSYCPVGRHELLTIMPCSVQKEVPRGADSSQQEKGYSNNALCDTDVYGLHLGFPAASCAAGVRATGESSMPGCYEDVMGKQDVKSLMGEQNDYNGGSSGLNHFGQDGDLVKKEVDSLEQTGEVFDHREHTENTSPEDIKIDLSSFTSHCHQKKSKSCLGNKDQVHIQKNIKIEEDICYSDEHDHEIKHTKGIEYSHEVQYIEKHCSNPNKQHKTCSSNLSKQHITVSANPSKKHYTDNSNTSKKHSADSSSHSHQHSEVSANTSKQRSADSSSHSHQHSEVGANTSKQHCTDSSSHSHQHSEISANTSKQHSADSSSHSHQHSEVSANPSKKQSAESSSYSHHHSEVSANPSKKQSAKSSCHSHQHSEVSANPSKKHSADSSKPRKKHSADSSNPSKKNNADRPSHSHQHSEVSANTSKQHSEVSANTSKQHSEVSANTSKQHSEVSSNTSKQHSEVSANTSKQHSEVSANTSKQHKEVSANTSKQHSEVSANTSKQHSEVSTNTSKQHSEVSANTSKQHSEVSANTSKQHSEVSANTRKQHSEVSANTSKQHSEVSDNTSKQHCEVSANTSKQHSEVSASTSKQLSEVSSNPSKKHCTSNSNISNSHSAVSSKCGTHPSKLHSKSGTQSYKNTNDQDIKDYSGNNDPEQTANTEELPHIKDGIENSQTEKFQENEPSMQSYYSETLAPPWETLNRLYDNNGDNCPLRSLKTQSKPVRTEFRSTLQSRSQSKPKLSNREVRKRRRSRRRSYEIRKLYECDTDDDSPPPCYCPKQKYPKFEWKSCTGTKENYREYMRQDTCSQNYVSLDNRVGTRKKTSKNVVNITDAGSKVYDRKTVGPSAASFDRVRSNSLGQSDMHRKSLKVDHRKIKKRFGSSVQTGEGQLFLSNLAEPDFRYISLKSKTTADDLKSLSAECGYGTDPFSLHGSPKDYSSGSSWCTFDNTGMAGKGKGEIVSQPLEMVLETDLESLSDQEEQAGQRHVKTKHKSNTRKDQTVCEPALLNLVEDLVGPSSSLGLRTDSLEKHSENMNTSGKKSCLSMDIMPDAVFLAPPVQRDSLGVKPNLIQDQYKTRFNNPIQSPLKSDLSFSSAESKICHPIRDVVKQVLGDFDLSPVNPVVSKTSLITISSENTNSVSQAISCIDLSHPVQNLGRLNMGVSENNNWQQCYSGDLNHGLSPRTMDSTGLSFYKVQDWLTANEKLLPTTAATHTLLPTTEPSSSLLSSSYPRAYFWDEQDGLSTKHNLYPAIQDQQNSSTSYTSQNVDRLSLQCHQQNASVNANLFCPAWATINRPQPAICFDSSAVNQKHPSSSLPEACGMVVPNTDDGLFELYPGASSKTQVFTASSEKAVTHSVSSYPSLEYNPQTLPDLNQSNHFKTEEVKVNICHMTKDSNFVDNQCQEQEVEQLIDQSKSNTLIYSCSFSDVSIELPISPPQIEAYMKDQEYGLNKISKDTNKICTNISVDDKDDYFKHEQASGSAETCVDKHTMHSVEVESMNYLTDQNNKTDDCMTKTGKLTSHVPVVAKIDQVAQKVSADITFSESRHSHDISTDVDWDVFNQKASTEPKYHRNCIIRPCTVRVFDIRKMLQMGGKTSVYLTPSMKKTYFPYLERKQSDDDESEKLFSEQNQEKQTSVTSVKPVEKRKPSKSLHKERCAKAGKKSNPPDFLWANWRKETSKRMTFNSILASDFEHVTERIDLSHPVKNSENRPRNDNVEKQSNQLIKQYTQQVTEDTQLVKEDTQLVKEDTQLVKEETWPFNEDTRLVKEKTGLVKEDTRLVKEKTVLVKENTQLVNEDADKYFSKVEAVGMKRHLPTRETSGCQKVKSVYIKTIESSKNEIQEIKAHYDMTYSMVVPCLLGPNNPVKGSFQVASCSPTSDINKGRISVQSEPLPAVSANEAKRKVERKIIDTSTNWDNIFLTLSEPRKKLHHRHSSLHKQKSFNKDNSESQSRNKKVRRSEHRSDTSHGAEKDKALSESKHKFLSMPDGKTQLGLEAKNRKLAEDKKNETAVTGSENVSFGMSATQNVEMKEAKSDQNNSGPRKIKTISSGHQSKSHHKHRSQPSSEPVNANNYCTQEVDSSFRTEKKNKPHKESSCSKTEKDKAHKQSSCSRSEKDKAHKESSCSKTEKDKAHKQSSCSRSEKDKAHKESSCSKTEKDKAHKESSFSKTEKDKVHKESSCSRSEKDKAHKESSCSKTEKDNAHKESSFSKTEKDKVHKESSCSKTEKDKAHKESSCSKTEKDKAHKESSCSKTEKEKVHKERSSSKINNTKSSKDKFRVKASTSSEILQSIEMLKEGSPMFIVEKKDQIKEKDGNSDKKVLDGDKLSTTSKLNNPLLIQEIKAHNSTIGIQSSSSKTNSCNMDKANSLSSASTYKSEPSVSHAENISDQSMEVMKDKAHSGSKNERPGVGVNERVEANRAKSPGKGASGKHIKSFKLSSTGLSDESKNVQTKDISKSKAPQEAHQHSEHERLKVIGSSTHSKQKTDFKLSKDGHKEKGREHRSNKILHGEKKTTEHVSKDKQKCNVTESKDVHSKHTKKEHRKTSRNTSEHKKSDTSEFTLGTDAQNRTVSIDDHKANVDQRFSCAFNENKLDDGRSECCANVLQRTGMTHRTTVETPRCDGTCDASDQTTVATEIDDSFRQKYCLPSCEVLSSVDSMLPLTTDPLSVHEVKEKSFSITEKDLAKMSKTVLASAYGSSGMSAIQGDENVICKSEPGVAPENLHAFSHVGESVSLIDGLTVASPSSTLKLDDTAVACQALTSQMSSIHSQISQEETESKIALNFDSNESGINTSLAPQSSPLLLTELNTELTLCKLEEKSITVSEVNEVLDPKHETMGHLVSVSETNCCQTSEGQGDNLDKTKEEIRFNLATCETNLDNPVPRSQCNTLDLKNPLKRKDIVAVDKSTCLCVPESTEVPWPPVENTNVEIKQERLKTLLNKPNEIIQSTRSSCDKGLTAYEELGTESKPYEEEKALGGKIGSREGAQPATLYREEEISWVVLHPCKLNAGNQTASSDSCDLNTLEAQGINLFAGECSGSLYSDSKCEEAKQISGQTHLIDESGSDKFSNNSRVIPVDRSMPAYDRKILPGDCKMKPGDSSDQNAFSSASQLPGPVNNQVILKAIKEEDVTDGLMPGAEQSQEEKLAESNPTDSNLIIISPSDNQITTNDNESRQCLNDNNIVEYSSTDEESRHSFNGSITPCPDSDLVAFESIEEGIAGELDPVDDQLLEEKSAKLHLTESRKNDQVTSNNSRSRQHKNKGCIVQYSSSEEEIGSIKSGRRSNSITAHSLTEDVRTEHESSHQVNCMSTVNCGTTLGSASGDSPEELTSDSINESKPCPDSDRPTLRADLRLDDDQTVNRAASQLTEQENQAVAFESIEVEEGITDELDPEDWQFLEKSAKLNLSESRKDDRVNSNNSRSRQSKNNGCIVQYSSSDTEEIGLIGSRNSNSIASVSSSINSLTEDVRTVHERSHQVNCMSTVNCGTTLGSASGDSPEELTSDSINESKPCRDSDRPPLRADLRLYADQTVNSPASQLSEPVNKQFTMESTGIDADVTVDIIPVNEQLFKEKSCELSPTESGEISSSLSDDLINTNNSGSRKSRNNDCIVVNSSPDTKERRSSPDTKESRAISSSASRDSITSAVSSCSTTSSAVDDRTTRERRRRNNDYQSHLEKYRESRLKTRMPRDRDSSISTDYTSSDEDYNRKYSDHSDDHYSRDNRRSDGDRHQHYGDYESFPYQKHTSHGLSSHRDRRYEQVTEDRRSRRAHPYSRLETSGNKEYATFNLPYKDLTDLMQSLTTESFKNSKHTCTAQRSSDKRFANYRFKRSHVPTANKKEKSIVELVRPEDIRDMEKRKNLADKVENMSFVDETTTKSLEEIVKVYTTAEKVEEVTDKEINNSKENVLKNDKEAAKVNTEQTEKTNETENQNTKSTEIKVNKVEKAEKVDAEKDKTKFMQTFIPVCDKLIGSGGVAVGQDEVQRCQSDMSLDEEEDDQHNLGRHNEGRATLVGIAGISQAEQTTDTVAYQRVTHSADVRCHSADVRCHSADVKCHSADVKCHSSMMKNASDRNCVGIDGKCTNSKNVTDCALENHTDFRTNYPDTIRESTCYKDSSSTMNREVISCQLPTNLPYPFSHTPYPRPSSNTLPAAQQQPLAGAIHPAGFKKPQEKKVLFDMEENAKLPQVIMSMEKLILTHEVSKESKNESSPIIITHSSSDSMHRQTNRPSEVYKNSKNQKQLSSNPCHQDHQAPQDHIDNVLGTCDTSKANLTKSGLKPITDNDLNNKEPEEISQAPSEISANSSLEILQRYLCTASKIIYGAKYASKMKEPVKETHQTTTQAGAPTSIGPLADVQSSSRVKNKILRDSVTTSLQPELPEVNTSPDCMLRLCPTEKVFPAQQQKEADEPRLTQLIAIQKSRCLDQQETEELNKLLAIGKRTFTQKQTEELNANVVNLKPKINKGDCCVKWKLQKITFVDKAEVYKPNPELADNDFKLISCSSDPSRDPRLTFRDPRLKPKAPREAPLKICDKKCLRLIPLEPINIGALLSPKPLTGAEDNT